LATEPDRPGMAGVDDAALALGNKHSVTHRANHVADTGCQGNGYPLFTAPVNAAVRRGSSITEPRQLAARNNKLPDKFEMRCVP
jgi:hypothetical protein